MLKPEDTHLGPLIREFRAELKQWGLPTNFKLCFDDEWYYADGSLWISIPFYLADARLSVVCQRSSAPTEGHSRKEFLKLLRHEYGHFLESAFNTRKWKIRRSVFGANPVYPKSYIPKKDPDQFVKNLPDHYAQSHPDEDFAETFAVFIRGASYWKKIYSSKAAYRKLLAMGQIIDECKKRKARKLDGSSFRPLKKNSMSVKQWLIEAKDQNTFRPKKIHPKLNLAKAYVQKNWRLSPVECDYILKAIAANTSNTPLAPRSKAFKLLINKIIRSKGHHLNM